jgi:hypothetical protein
MKRIRQHARSAHANATTSVMTTIPNLPFLTLTGATGALALGKSPQRITEALPGLHNDSHKVEQVGMAA